MWKNKDFIFIFCINPNKSGIPAAPAAPEGEACWRFFSNYCGTILSFLPKKPFEQ